MSLRSYSVYMRVLFFAAVFMVALNIPYGRATAATSAINAASVQTQFDWLTKWGLIDFTNVQDLDTTTTTVVSDPLIPSTYLPPKRAIKNAIYTYGTLQTSAALALDKTYSLDVNGDGVSVRGLYDIVLDGSAYFKQYANSDSTLCTTTAEGTSCYLTIYTQSAPTNIVSTWVATTTSVIVHTATGTTTKTVTATHSCPATAALNTSCDTSCPATIGNCPGNFQYNMNLAYDNRVFAWNFISAASFDTWHAALVSRLQAEHAATLDETGIYTPSDFYARANARPILTAALPAERCTDEEISANGSCVKYFQYVDTTTGFKDLYFTGSYTGGNFNSLYTTATFSQSKAGLAGVRGQTFGGGTALGIAPGASIDIQLSDFTRTMPDGTLYRTATTSTGIPGGFVAYHIANTNTSSADNYFIPTNSDDEFSSVLNNPPTGITVSDVSYRFTAWTGTTSCPSISGQADCTGLNDQIGTGTSTSAVSERYCQSSTSAIMPCEVCMAAQVSGYEAGCLQQVTCPGVACCIHGAYLAAGSIEACQVAIAHHCIAGEGHIALPKGKTKLISKIKGGDTVLGFDSEKGRLKPVKVKLVAITEGQSTLAINDLLSVTPPHEFVKPNGQRIHASDLKVGDKILKDNGKVLKVETIKPNEKTETVYNLQLESGIGFVVDGVRVMSAQSNHGSER